MPSNNRQLAIWIVCRRDSIFSFESTVTCPSQSVPLLWKLITSPRTPRFPLLFLHAQTRRRALARTCRRLLVCSTLSWFVPLVKPKSLNTPMHRNQINASPPLFSWSSSNMLWPLSQMCPCRWRAMAGTFHLWSMAQTWPFEARLGSWWVAARSDFYTMIRFYL